MSVGEMIVGEMSVGEMSVGEMSVGEMSVGEMIVGEMSVGEMIVGEMSVDELRWCRMNVFEHVRNRKTITRNLFSNKESPPSINKNTKSFFRDLQ